MVMVSGAIGLQEKGGRSPPPKRGRLGGGRCICDTLLSPSACSTEGFFAEKRLSYPAQQGERKGVVKGESVPLDRVLVPFTRVKGTPRRRAVLTKFSKRLAPLKAISHYYLTGRGGWGAGLRLAEEVSRRRREETVSCPSAGRQKENRALRAAGSALRGKEKAPVGALGAGDYCCRI